MYIIYGITNCDTVKKALKWLKSNGIFYEFYDYKKKGISSDKLHDWKLQVGIDSLINKKAVTWKQLDEATQDSIKDEKAAINLMSRKTSVIKRPILENKNKIITVGFNEDEYKNIFKL